MDSDEIPLISADRYSEYAYLSPATGSVRIVTGDPLQAGLTFKGVFGRTDMDAVAIYRSAGELYVQSEQFTLRLDPEMSASVSRGPENARAIEITQGANRLLVIRYAATPRWNSELAEMVDFTWTEEEDFDFGLKIANVINDERRFASFYAD